MAHHWEQVNAVHFCARIGKSSAETHNLLLQAYQQEALRSVAAKDYYSRFKKRGNSFPEAYGRRSLDNVKNKPKRKEVCDTGVTKKGESKSSEHGSSQCLDINLHLQLSKADSIELDISPTNSVIKNFLNIIESTCNEHLNPQTLKITLNQENVPVGEKVDQIPQKKSDETKPINGDMFVMDDTISSSLPTDETVVTTEETTIDSIQPTNEVDETTEDITIESVLSKDETVETTEEATVGSIQPTDEMDVTTEDITIGSDVSEDETAEATEENTEDSIQPTNEVDETTEDITIGSDVSEDETVETTEETAEDSILPTNEVDETTEDITIGSDVSEDEIVETTEERNESIVTTEDTTIDSIPETVEMTEETTQETLLETPKTTRTPKRKRSPRKTRSKCRCLTCKLKS